MPFDMLRMNGPPPRPLTPFDKLRVSGPQPIPLVVSLSNHLSGG